MIKASRILECVQIELVEKLEDLLSVFYKMLLAHGLKPSTAEKHVANTELFLIEYHAFYFLDEIHTITSEKIYDFLGVWYFQKVRQPSEKDLIGITVSLKRFFSFASQKGILPKSRCDQLKLVCNDKDYFLHRLQKYQEDPEVFILPHPKSTKPGTTLREFANRGTQQKMDDILQDMLEDPKNKLTLEEMIGQLMNKFKSFQPKNNVLFLHKYMKTSSAVTFNPPKVDLPSTPTTQTLKEHCMAIHRYNLVFMRWLDRFGCQLGDLPTESIAACLDSDGLLTCLIAQLEVEMISIKEILMGHQFLDMMDKMLWSARQQIAQCLGLDLRSLPL